MTGSLDQTVRLWDTNGMQEAFTLDKKNNYDPKKVQLRAAQSPRLSLSLSCSGRRLRTPLCFR